MSDKDGRGQDEKPRPLVASRANRWGQGLPTAERLELLLGMSLDAIEDVLAEPEDYRNAVLTNAKQQAAKTIVNLCYKAGIERQRTENWREYLDAARKGAEKLDAPAKDHPAERSR